MKKAFVLLIILTFTFPVFLFAEDTNMTEFNKELFIEAAKKVTTLRLGIKDCIMYSLKNNSEIKIVKIEPKIKEDDVKIAKSVFEPTFNVDYLLNENSVISNEPFITGDLINTTRTALFNLGMEGMLTPGTRYSVEFLNSYLKTDSSYQVINPYYKVEPKLTVTQPILRNFGTEVNTAQIAISRNAESISEEVFRETVIDIISSTKSAYYNYIYAIKAQKIARASLKRAHDLLIINILRYKKGLISSVDLLETETAVAQKMKYLIATESAVKTSEDNLKMITNLIDDPAAWNAKLELIDIPEFITYELDLVQSLKDAFEFRPDYMAMIIKLKNNDIMIKVAKNGTLPIIDLIGSFGLNGMAEDYSDAFQGISSDYKDWTIGTRISIPWGTGDRAKYDKTKLEKAQAIIGLKRLEQKIILEVRDKVRDVNIQYRQVQAAKIAMEKEDKNYRAQMERYKSGQVSTHDILDYQDRFAMAELVYTTALIDYNKAIINLEKAEGLTLARNDIRLEE